MDIKGESTLSRPFILSLTATILWGLTGVSILQFSVGGLVWGVLLAAAAVVLVAIVAGGSCAGWRADPLREPTSCYSSSYSQWWASMSCGVCSIR